MPVADLEFVVDEKIRTLGIPLASALICGLDNHPRETQEGREASDPEWSRFSQAFIDNEPILRGYRELHTAVGRSNKRFVSSIEALIRGWIRNQSLPRVNRAVDLYNRLSLQSLLSIGAHDAAKLSGDLSFRITDGTEHFVPLGGDRSVSIPPGEYAYVDSSNDVLCRLECRQADKSKLDVDSTDCVFIVQGNGNTPETLVQQTLDSLVEEVLARCGGSARQLHPATAG